MKEELIVLLAFMTPIVAITLTLVALAIVDRIKAGKVNQELNDEEIEALLTVPASEEIIMDDEVLPDLHGDETLSDEEVLLDVMLSCAKDLNYEVMPDGSNAEVIVMVKKAQ